MGCFCATDLISAELIFWVFRIGPVGDVCTVCFFILITCYVLSAFSY